MCKELWSYLRMLTCLKRDLESSLLNSLIGKTGNGEPNILWLLPPVVYVSLFVLFTNLPAREPWANIMRVMESLFCYRFRNAIERNHVLHVTISDETIDNSTDN